MGDDCNVTNIELSTNEFIFIYNVLSYFENNMNLTLEAILQTGDSALFDVLEQCKTVRKKLYLASIEPPASL